MNTTLAIQPSHLTRLSSLGETLEFHRLGQGLTTDDLALKSTHLAGDFEALESGDHEFTDAKLASLIDHYSIDRGRLRAEHAQAVLNLEEGLISVSPSRRSIDEPDADTVLLSYVALLYRQNNLSIGSDLPIRQIDLTVVRRALALRRDVVEDRVRELVQEKRRGAGLRSRRTHRQLAVMGGLAVMGAVVIIPATSGNANAALSLDANPSAGEAVATVVQASPSQASAVVVPLTGDIGSALTIERSDAVLAGPAAATQITVSQITGSQIARSDVAGLEVTAADIAREVASLSASPEVDRTLVDGAIAAIEASEIQPAAPTRSPAVTTPVVAAPVGDIGDALIIER